MDTKMIVKARAKPRFSTELGINIKMHERNTLSRPLCTYPACLWCTRHFIGHSMRVDDLYLWYFSFKHSVWVYNTVPNKRSGITLIKILTNTNSNHRDLRRAHVWGCPVFVLEAKLKDDQKLPKWNWRSRLGKFLGFSDEHSTLVVNVLNLRTG